VRVFLRIALDVLFSDIKMIKSNMKKTLPLILFTLCNYLIVIKSYAQNDLPKIVNFDVNADTIARTVVMRYKVEDLDSDSLIVMVRIYSASGDLIETGPHLTGDINHPLKAAGEKKIVWHYPDTLKSILTCKVKLIVDDLYKFDVAELVSLVDTTRLKTDMVTTIYGVRHNKRPDHIRSVRTFIYESFHKNKLEVSRQDIDVGIEKYRFNGQNIIGQINGMQDEQKSFVLTAHFDTQKDSPGADDNGSGVVGMLEAMRILAKYSFKYSIKFIGFDLEEVGFLGSRVYVSDGGIGKNELIQGVINFDMIGSYSSKPNSQIVPPGFDQIFPKACAAISADSYRANFAINTSNEKSVALSAAFSDAAKNYVPQLKVVSLVASGNGEDTPQLAASDHVVFWINGYHALHIGDGGETRNIYLDTKKDVLNLINYTFIGNIVKSTIATLAQLSEIQHSVATMSNIKPASIK
jgi:hypothetical protein